MGFSSSSESAKFSCPKSCMASRRAFRWDLRCLRSALRVATACLCSTCTHRRKRDALRGSVAQNQPILTTDTKVIFWLVSARKGVEYVAGQANGRAVDWAADTRRSSLARYCWIDPPRNPGDIRLTPWNTIRVECEPKLHVQESNAQDRVGKMRYPTN